MISSGIRLSLWLLLAFLSVGRSAPGDENWDDRFGLPGISGFGRAVVVRDNMVFVGGGFSAVGGMPANNVAMWDGTNWYTFGAGLNGNVSALSFLGSDLVVAGDFSEAGGVTANHLAKWDGTNWSSLGEGVDGTIAGLTVIGSELFVVGHFSSAGGMPVSNIAKWNGNNWSDVGGGLNGSVTTSCANDGDLFVGGWFSQAGTVSATNIAKWNGSHWSALAGGRTVAPAALRTEGGAVYVFSVLSAGMYETGFQISKWDGSGWSKVVSGQFTLPCFDCSALATDMIINGSDFYITGLFSAVNGVPASAIALWDGVAWSNLGGGLDSAYSHLAMIGESLYAVGSFGTAGGTGAPGVAQWDGAKWMGLGKGYGVPAVNAMVTSGNSVYVGGVFQSTSNGGVGALGKWDGAAWASIDALPQASQPEITIWGLADAPNGMHAIAAENRVVKWTGTNWLELGAAGSPVLAYRAQVYVLLARATELYAGGMFNSMSGASAGSLARWDGTNWSMAGGGMERATYPAYVLALAARDHLLYAGGAFTSAGGISANSIAVWNGTNWSALSSGVFEPYPYPSGVVNTLALAGNDLYAGGVFTSAGGVDAACIAKWDGTNWSALGSGVSGPVSALVANGSDLYVGGTFTTAGGIPARNLARWDGTNWHALGSGVGTSSERIGALGANGSELFVGGKFSSAGNKPAYNFSIWHIPHALAIRNSGQALRLSWPVTGTNFTLETSDTLAPASWRMVSTVVSIEGAECVITNELAGSNRFYRLRRQ